jgi:hypothetical protein
MPTEVHPLAGKRVGLAPTLIRKPDWDIDGNDGKSATCPGFATCPGAAHQVGDGGRDTRLDTASVKDDADPAGLAGVYSPMIALRCAR